MNVALFVTCLTDTYYPRAGIATVKVLRHLGCEVEFPAGQTCCGQPMFNNGYQDEARVLAKRMIQIFEHSRWVVTPSGSCASMVREHYPPLFAGDPAWESGARGLASRTFEFVEFLVKVLHIDPGQLGASWEGSATYHYSCHLRGLGITDQTPRLLEQIKGLKYMPLPRMEQCCGFGGTFALNYPQVSGALARDKAQCIAQSGAGTVVVNDAGCAMNIAGTCRRLGVEVEFKHAAEILAESLGLLERGS